MNAQDRLGFRLGVLSELVARSDTKLGRTALMKLSYLLQIVKGVPLSYNFRLYTYGPYDSDVLNDLGQAETLRAVESNMVPYPGGYGYEFSIGPENDRVRSQVASKLHQYNAEMNWVLEEFGDRTAAELELLSTIIYADRDNLDRRSPASLDELCKQVNEIKPRFSNSHIKDRIISLKEKEILLARNN